ncbi:MAG: PH domain-containing protein [Anaerolineae bacterium]
MGYIENVLGENERIVYRTHLHVLVLLQRILGSLFSFLVFLGLGLTVLLAPADRSGDQIRFMIGVIALCSLALPLYLIVSTWVRGQRGREFLRTVWRWILVGLFILAVSLVMMVNPTFAWIGWLAIAIAVVPFAELVRIFLDWVNEKYLITNRRVMEVKGIINKHVRDSALEKVNDVDLTQSLVGRILGYGTVQIITGSDIGVNMFRRISNPVRFKREMLNAKERLHEAMPSTQEEDILTPTSPVVEADIPGLIAELDALRQKGILSEEEFQAKKKELLERL